MLDLVETIQKLKIGSIAVPPLGCGNGGLKWNEVRPKIEDALSGLKTVRVILYAPGETPDASQMPNKTAQPKMTPGRAALILLMDRYLKGLMDPFVSLLEIHKLMYFLQEAGEPLKLRYQAEDYGPYSPNLRHVLIHLEKRYTQGYGVGKDTPSKPIELLPGAVEQATALIRGEDQLQSRIQAVTVLIDGFEDSYGMELLSSVHWVMRENVEARTPAEAAIAAVHGWNERKARLLKKEHLLKAWQRIKDLQWEPQPVAV